jgi:hypothetical protein
MPSGQEITLSCTLGDSHKRERAVLFADIARHFFPVTSLGHVATDLYVVRTVLTSIAMYGTVQVVITRASKRIGLVCLFYECSNKFMWQVDAKWMKNGFLI